ncbi:hypothetical protein HHI36_015663 [Cryptolaemus montrouzieri]|uniref:Uncharacterized protein n=1 Tax=Cryptolaemus montrouzieri TaxID=559131 RepID=A0ABD2N6F7_9CUCU
MFIGFPPSSVTVTGGENKPERGNGGMHNLCNSLVLRHIEADEVVSVIRTLRNTNSVGMDAWIPVEVSKFVAGKITTVIAHIVNLAFDSGIYPEALKTSKMLIWLKHLIE